jgi:3',5'-cyclic AMP phosphodiesterase CpdA
VRIAHLSDLHFSHATLSLTQFFSKRWIGNGNLIFSRKKAYDGALLSSLPELFQKLKIDTIVISGDLTTTSQKKEFAKAAAFIRKIEEKGIPVLVVPGNHDHYTRCAYKNKTFYEFFPASYSSKKEGIFAFNLKDHGLAAKELAPGWWIIALDTALATSLISSRGLFSEQLENTLTQALSLIPKKDSVIILNHFPLFDNDGVRKELIRSASLRKLIQNSPQVKLYLNGHTHRHCIADLRPNHFPIVLDSGSTANRKTGSWNLIDVSNQGCSVEVFKFEEPVSQTHFQWIAS